jgi:hypothetical protein
VSSPSRPWCSWLPDPRCTAGSIDPAVTQANIHRTICVSGYTRKVRPSESQTEPFKYHIAYHAYGMSRTEKTKLDHLVSLELGGSNDAANLWPENYRGFLSADDKDRLENAIHDAVLLRANASSDCSGDHRHGLGEGVLRREAG